MRINKKVKMNRFTLLAMLILLSFFGSIGFAQATELSVGKVNNLYGNINHSTAFTLDSGFNAAAIAECPNFNGYAVVHSGNRVLQELVVSSFKDQTPIQVRTIGCSGRNNVWLRVYSITSSLPPP